MQTKENVQDELVRKVGRIRKKDLMDPSLDAFLERLGRSPAELCRQALSESDKLRQRYATKESQFWIRELADAVERSAFTKRREKLLRQKSNHAFLGDFSCVKGFLNGLVGSGMLLAGGGDPNNLLFAGVVLTCGNAVLQLGKAVYHYASAAKNKKAATKDLFFEYDPDIWQARKYDAFYLESFLRANSLYPVLSIFPEMEVQPIEKVVELTGLYPESACPSFHMKTYLDTMAKLDIESLQRMRALRSAESVQKDEKVDRREIMDL